MKYLNYSRQSTRNQVILKQKSHFCGALIIKEISVKSFNTNKMKPNISRYILCAISHGTCLLELFWEFWHDPYIQHWDLKKKKKNFLFTS